MPSDPAVAGVVNFEEARRIVEEHAQRALTAWGDWRATETLDLLAARGRVLAEAIVADRDFPPFPRATRDGYAVRSADVAQVPVRLEVVGEIKAGDSPRASLNLDRGQAAAIMTGAPLPAGADAVVMVEYATVVDASADAAKNPHPNVARNATLGWGTLKSFVEVQRSVASGENVVARGAEARAGQVLVESGRRLDHALIGIAASVGKSRVQVFRRPRVAVLATGDEVVEIDAAPGAAQIRNSNSYSLTAQIEAAGGEAVRLPIAPDEPARLRELIAQGFECDLLLIAGGISMGKYDLVEQVLGEMKGEFYFTGVRMQPGKPAVFGECPCGAGFPFGLAQGRLARADGSPGAGARTGVSPPQNAQERRVPGTPVSAPHYFFGLPGNPVSTMVTFRLFAQPMIGALGGARPEPLVFLRARLKTEVRTKMGLTRFLPAVISGAFASAEVELVAWQGSGDIAALARANCYLVIPPDRERIEAGEWVSVLSR